MEQRKNTPVYVGHGSRFTPEESAAIKRVTKSVQSEQKVEYGRAQVDGETEIKGMNAYEGQLTPWDRTRSVRDSIRERLSDGIELGR